MIKGSKKQQATEQTQQQVIANIAIPLALNSMPCIIIKVPLKNNCVCETFYKNIIQNVHIPPKKMYICTHGDTKVWCLHINTNTTCKGTLHSVKVITSLLTPECLAASVQYPLAFVSKIQPWPVIYKLKSL